MPDLVAQPTRAPTRKVAAGTITGTVLGPVIAYASVKWLGADMSAECAAQISDLLVYGAAAIGGLASGAMGYLVRERATAPSA